MNTNDPSESVVTLADGKYQIRHSGGTGLRALRNGEPWLDLTGDNLVLALVQRIEELQEDKKRAEAGITDEVVEAACRALCAHNHWNPDEPVTYSGTRKKARNPDGHVVLQWEMHVPEARIFLQSAARAMQGDRETLRALVDATRDLVARCDGKEGMRADGSHIDTCAANYALAAYELQAIADDLSRAIGETE